MTNVLRLFANEVGGLLALALPTLKLFDGGLSHELPAPVLASNGVDAVANVRWDTDHHVDGFDLGFEWWAAHAAPCARLQKNRQLSLRKVLSLT